MSTTRLYPTFLKSSPWSLRSGQGQLLANSRFLIPPARRVGRFPKLPWEGKLRIYPILKLNLTCRVQSSFRRTVFIPIFAGRRQLGGSRPNNRGCRLSSVVSSPLRLGPGLRWLILDADVGCMAC